MGSRECDHCKRYVELEDQLVRTTSLSNYEYDKLFQVIINGYRKCDVHGTKKHHEGNGKPKGLFAGTLTMSNTDTYNEEDMIHAIKKIMAQETCPVEKYAWYLEYQDNGTPHIHFIYKTKADGRIHAKVFKRYWKIWDESKKLGKGFRGGYHSKVDSETAYLEYIEKDGGRHQNNWLQ